jgi:hypothetical protein
MMHVTKISILIQLKFFKILLKNKTYIETNLDLNNALKIIHHSFS